MGKIYIVTPNLKSSYRRKRGQGGVCNYYLNAQKWFSEEVYLLPVNSGYDKWVLKRVLNIWYLLVCILRIVVEKPSAVVVNTSLASNALKRDGIILRIASISGAKRIVFWRGWDIKKENLIRDGSGRKNFEQNYLKASHHLCLNTYVMEYLKQHGVSQDKMTLTTTIVNDSIFKGQREKKNPFTLLFLSRIEKYKGIYETLEIYKKFANRKQCKLLVAGNGSELENVKAMVKKQDIPNVYFLGYLSGKEKFNAFRSSDAYIFPSYSEGMPNSVLEAMATGLPIICTRVGALNDFFEDGRMGFSFSLPIIVDEFISAIDVLYQNESVSETISRYNSAYAIRNFKASEVIPKLEVQLRKI